MQQPEPVWWEIFLKWVESNTILFMTFGLVWKGFDMTFKYLSESRDQRFRQIVKEENKVLEDRFNDRLDTLTDLLMKGHK